MNFTPINPFHWVRWTKKKFSTLPEFLQMAIIALCLISVRLFFIGLYQVPTGSMEPTMLVGEGFFCNKFIFFSKIDRGDIVSFNDPLYQYSDNKVLKAIESYIYGPSNWTKRVIGIPGDHLEGRIEGGRPVIYRNGEKIDEPYINPYPLVEVVQKAWVLSMKFPFLVETVEPHYRTFDPAFSIIDEKNQPFYRIREEDIIGSLKHPVILKPHTPTITDHLSDIFDVYLGEDEYWLMGDNRKGSTDARYFGPIPRSIIRGKILFRIFSFDTSNSFIYELIFDSIHFFTKKFRSWKRWFNFVH